MLAAVGFVLSGGDVATKTICVQTSDVQRGHWCEACNLPSAIGFTVHELTDDAVSTLGVVGYCTDCHEWMLDGKVLPT